MFGRKRIAELEYELSLRKTKAEQWKGCYDRMISSNTRLAISNEKQAREIDHTNRKLVLAERAANTAIDANEEFARLHAKDQTEIRELKADIAEQVRINRAYAEEIGQQKRLIKDLMETVSMLDKDRVSLKQSLKMHISSLYGRPVYVEPSVEPEPIKFEGEPEPSRIFEDQLAKRDKTIKRLRAKVKKLASDNKAMAAEVLHNRNSM